MFHFFEAITNNKGDALIGYYVRAVDAAGHGATLYADNSMTPIASVSGLADAARVDSNGNASFYVAVGDYRLDIYATNGTSLVESIEHYPMSSDADLAEQAEQSAADAAASAADALSYLESLVDLPTSGMTLTAASRAALAMLDTSTELSAVFDGSVWELRDYADYSSLVTADTQKGLIVRSTFDTAKVWLRRFSGPALSTWFGVSPSESAANNYTYFTAALVTLKALAVNVSAGVFYGYNEGSIGLHTPAGLYTFNATLVPDHALDITGDYTGSGGGTVFKWTTNVHGFTLNGYDGADVHANGVKLKGLFLLGTAGGTAKHAVNQNGYANIEDVFCKDWSGDGVHLVGTPPGGGDGCIYRNIMGYNVGWTLYLDGADSNACQSFNISGSPVRFGAIFDGSGIGCHHIGGVCNSAGNVASYVTRCHVSGHIYMVAFGQESWCSTNAPTGAATHNQGWLYLSEGSASSTQPTWTTAQTWYFSSPYCVDPTDENTRTRFEGHYVETGLNAIILNSPSSVAGGQYLVPVYTTAGYRHGGYTRGEGGWMLFNNAIHTQGTFNNRFENSISEFGPETDPGNAPDQELQLRNWNEYSKISFWRQGTEVARQWSAGANFFYDCNQHTWRTNGGGTNLLQLTAANGLDVLTGGLKINGTAALDSSRNGSLASVALGGGTALTKAVVYAPSITPSSVGSNTVAEQTFAVAGLTTADKVIVNPPAIANATGIAGARVSAADTLAIRFTNPTGGSLTPTSGTYTVLAFRS